MKTIGVLALQGDYEAHAKALAKAGARAVEVRTAAELSSVDGLVIPGGESTTMLKLLDAEGMFDALRDYCAKMPVFGTCAGAILLATGVINPAQRSLAAMDIDVERNAYGRQLDSRVVRIAANGLGEVEAVFIRAPIIRRVGEKVRVLASYEGTPVLIDDGQHLVATFHPELTADERIHALFAGRV